MLYVGVGLFLIAYVLILVLPTWRRRRAHDAKEVPGRVPPAIRPEQLEERLESLVLEHPEVVVEAHGERVTVSWNLDEAAMRARPYEKDLTPTYALELQITGESIVNVRYAVGTILWEVLDGDGSRPAPSIDWQWPLEPVPGPELDANDLEALDPGTAPRRSLRHLVLLTRQVVLDAGYTWQPVIDIVPGRGATLEASRGVDSR